MNIKKLNIKIKCDMPNCTNMADIKLEKPGFLMSAGMYICSDCVKEMYLALGQIVVPKSPENMLNKKIVKKEKL